MSQSKREEIEARRAARRKAHEELHNEQSLDDLEALDRLEEEHGWGRIVGVHLDPVGWKPGAVTMVIAKLPLSSEATFKRFLHEAHRKEAKAAQLVDAETALAESCLVYPEKGSDLYRATFELFAGAKGLVAAEIARAVQGRAAEEGK